MHAIITIAALIAAQSTQVWAVEYDGEVYTYAAAEYDDPRAEIITLDGRVINVKELV